MCGNKQVVPCISTLILQLGRGTDCLQISILKCNIPETQIMPSLGQLKYQHSTLEVSQQCCSPEKHCWAQPGTLLVLLSPTGFQGAHSLHSRASLQSHHPDHVEIHTLAGSHCNKNIIFVLSSLRSTSILVH